jgi:hypothetical protein
MKELVQNPPEDLEDPGVLDHVGVNQMFPLDWASHGYDRDGQKTARKALYVAAVAGGTQNLARYARPAVPYLL